MTIKEVHLYKKRSKLKGITAFNETFHNPLFLIESKV